MESNSTISFIWDIHHDCNYRCPYCWFYSRWHTDKRKTLYLSVKEWINHWDKVYEKYGSVYINITGGEPFIYPSFTELIRALAEKHTIGIISNLSFDIETFLNFQISPNIINISGTFHPLFTNLDTFLNKAKLLKEKGFSNIINFCTYPAQLYMIEHLREIFGKAGFYLKLQPFWGEYHGKYYPESFTERERELHKSLLESEDHVDYRVNKQNPKGKLCRAGIKDANISHEGKVTRCGPMYEYVLGNIVNANFELLHAPEPCGVDFCPCEEFQKIICEKVETLNNT